MEIRWQVEDGYCGGSRPQRFNINLENFVEDDMNESEIWEEVCLLVEEEFRQCISWSIKNEGDIRAAIRKSLSEAI
jgi:hypothetical protein